MQSKKLKPRYWRNLPHIQPIGAAFFVTFRLKGSIPWIKVQELRAAYRSKVAEFRAKYGKNANAYIQEERHRFFLAYDQMLDRVLDGPTYLEQEEVAAEVIKQLHRFDGGLYSLLAYCVMPNHVHILIDTGSALEKELPEDDLESLEYQQLHRIMNRVKGASSRYCNLALVRRERNTYAILWALFEQYCVARRSRSSGYAPFSRLVLPKNNLTLLHSYFVPGALGRSGKFWQRESFDRFIRDEKHLNNVISYILENPVKANLAGHWEGWPFSYLKIYGE